ncbi:MAG: hypothetical protein GWN61_22435 [candidate division Zixibacteria bacterium]|nr:hypothetical protein [candidate division Zixibacteria bacterium]NIR67240.1 hypothetical protein [candidate division Zixibacteria bacterium]NIS16084.1 hypothetical protein [candidate division Zixibacteria bacterium]NIS48622.1 hypothetical protein [candidate division Zixibacteria bacterium]NIU16689.1 hypothetical protein [candidate division Zixibacteria bacterium]
MSAKNKIHWLIKYVSVFLVIGIGTQFCTSSTGPEDFDVGWSLRIGLLGGDESIGVFQGTYVNLPLYIIADSLPQIDSFNLKISYNADALTFIDVEPGEMLHGWEDLIHTSKVYSGYDTLLGVLDMTGIAGTNSSGSELMSISQIEAETDSIHVLDLKFWVTDDRVYECHFVPVNFFWEDCDDNVIYYGPGNYWAISEHVYRRNWTDPLDPYVETIPEDGTIDEDDHIYGIFDSCQDASANGGIDFYHGGVDIACAQPIDVAVGDINLNNISYELTDLFLLAEYFISGESVFTIDRAKQLRASDTNHDRIFPTTADLQYMNRVIMGDAIGTSHLEHFADTVNVIIHENVISLESRIDLGATLFVFEGEIGFSVLYNDFNIKSIYKDGETRILFYSIGQDKFEAGTTPILQLDAPADLKSCESSGYYGNMVVTKIID